jgi:hypothetical protein
MTHDLKRRAKAGLTTAPLAALAMLAIGCGSLKPGSSSSGGGDGGDGGPTNELVASAIERDDGSFDVVCTDGRELVATAEEIQSGAACAPVVATDTGTDTDGEDDDEAGDGTDTVGIKNGDQIIAHYSLMTGVKYEDIANQGTKDEILRLKSSLSGDNAPEKFTPSMVLAASKLATIYCDQFLSREQVAQTQPDSGIESKLPQLDFNSAFLGKEIARPIYDYFTGIFWGVDTATQPKEADTYAALDAMMDAFAEPYDVGGGNMQTPNLRGSLLGICVSTAASFPALEL